MVKQDCIKVNRVDRKFGPALRASFLIGVLSQVSTIAAAVIVNQNGGFLSFVVRSVNINIESSFHALSITQ